MAPGTTTATVDIPARFGRQLTLPGFGEEQQRRLRGATALVAGVGGLGGTAALYLAAAGVGRLILMHEGNLEEEDLNRQILMRPGWLGLRRADCARRSLRELYPDVEVVALPERVTAGTVHPWLLDADVALDCRHNFPERYALNLSCVLAATPLVEAAMNAMEGYLTVVLPGETPCLACLFPEGDPGWDPMSFPVLGAVPGALGCLAALEAIKVLSGFGRPLAGRLLTFDLSQDDFRTYRVRRRPDCDVCGEKQR